MTSTPVVGPEVARPAASGDDSGPEFPCLAEGRGGASVLVWEGLLSWVPWLGQYWYLRRARIEYMRQLLVEYEGLSARAESVLTKAERIEVMGITALMVSDPGKTRWDDVQALQRILLRIYPDSRLQRTMWSLRMTFRDIAGPVAYADYLASKPPNPDDEKESPVALRADAEQLLAVILFQQTMRNVVERESNHLARRLATLTALLCGAAGFLVYWSSFRGFDASIPRTGAEHQVVLGVLFAGALGGLVSTQQRLHGVPFTRTPSTRLLTLSQSWYAVYYSPIMGALGACVLAVIFASGLIKGDMFPSFTPDKDGGSSTLASLVRTMAGSKAELAKLMVWSFLAGFSERLVPDTLDRLTARAGIARVQPASK